MLKNLIPTFLFQSNRQIIFITVAFLLLLLPALSQVSTYHSDEHYYTDAAVYMLQNQEYLSPHNADGSLRTKKPIITYWALMASYTLIGIHFFAARLPFLIAGGIMLWLTYQMSMRLFGNRRNAVLAAAILASNIQFIMLALRATPDILNVLFLNISLYGFIMLIFNRDQRLFSYICAYGGAALAAETKGLLGMTPVVMALIFLWLPNDKNDKKVGLRALIHWPVIGTAAVLGSLWYGYILFQHGHGALGYFFSDQVGGKLGGSKFYILLNVYDYLLGIFRNFMPWSLVLLIGIVIAPQKWRTVVRRNKRATMFIAAWFTLLFVIFIGSSDCRTRYLVPAYPLMSVLFASLLEPMIEEKGVSKAWKWCCGLLLALIAVVGALLLPAGLVIDGRLIAAGLILLAISVPVLFYLPKNPGVPKPTWLGLILLIMFAGVRVFVIPVFEFAPSEKITACILGKYDKDQRVSVWAGKRQNYTRQIYTLSKGRILVNYFPGGTIPENPSEDSGSRSPLILTLPEKEKLAAGGYGFEQCGYVFRTPDLATLWQTILEGERKEVLNTMRQPLYLAWRSTPDSGK